MVQKFNEWDNSEGINLPHKLINLLDDPTPVNPVKTWTIDAKKDGFNKEEVDDIIIMMRYKISNNLH